MPLPPLASVRKPVIKMMNEDGIMEVVPDESISEAALPVELGDVFNPVRISPEAIDQASLIVAQEHWQKERRGLHRWLYVRAEHVFKSCSIDKMYGDLRSLRYEFAFDDHGPVLKTVRLNGSAPVVDTQ